MDLGTAIAIFLAIAVALMILFCLLTKYFNYKLQKSIDDGQQVYSVIDEISTENDDEGEYEQFVRKREQQNKSNKHSKKEDKEFLLEMTNIRNPLMSPSAHGISKLRRRLDGQTISMRPETDRSSNTMRSFQPDIIDTNRSNGRQQEELQNINTQRVPKSILRDHKNKGKSHFPKVIKHKFVSKIIAYTEEGLQIIQNYIRSLRKLQGTQEIAERKVMKLTTISPNQKTFQEQLEVYGFEKDEYSAYKFSMTVEIPHMKEKEEYPVELLKCTEEKEAIDFVEYYRLKSQIQDAS